MARNRYVRIMLLPVLAPIFLIGWVMAYYGEKVEGKKHALRTARPAKEEALEVGLLADLSEELQLIEKPQKRQGAT